MEQEAGDGFKKRFIGYHLPAYRIGGVGFRGRFYFTQMSGGFRSVSLYIYVVL